MDSRREHADSGSDHSALSHVVGDGDYHNVIGLLELLSHQLELLIEDSLGDYQCITRFCVEAEIEEAACSTSRRKTEVIRALQYYDRSVQRIDHVKNSLQLLATNLRDESWSAIDLDLEAEIGKTNSFLSEVQIGQLYRMAGTKDVSLKQENNIESDSASGDVELF